MPHAHHHAEPRGKALTSAARTALEGAGEQWTTMRANVYGALAAEGRPASAYDIAESVSKAVGRRIAANTVYRILDLFVTTNLAQRVESANAYIVNAHPGCLHDCIFLICDTCGKTEHLDDDGISADLRRAAGAAGFTPVRPVVEVRGTLHGLHGKLTRAPIRGQSTPMAQRSKRHTWLIFLKRRCWMAFIRPTICVR